VLGARWNEDRWELETSNGPVTAKVLVGATGPLVEPSCPDFPGLERFQGRPSTPPAGTTRVD
jgi:cation diffusion facilitator CzcD-associated flavoprotein CzcO